ncbi:hypothetical protein [Schumannella soli]|uniref:Uncharacterized protein n=1 Tax=Schumannella soli TaxID=2590779 RepID=A0A506XNI5_9MICO|nr:hypothetical protein [Schumannella soli]TPW74224.1 hypothetical protein FJ657_16505 [Schumannella soli]
MFGNSFVGWHLMLVIGVLLFFAAIIVGIVLLARVVARRVAPDPERARLQREVAEQRARAERAERDSDGLV